MYKGKQPSSSTTTTTKNTTKSYKSESQIGKKSSTVSKDRVTAPKFSSFNNIIQTNQSIDMNNSRRQSHNQSPGNSIVFSAGAHNNSSSKMNRNKFTNSYAAQFQDKMNKSKNSKDDSLNMSKRLPTNTSVNNYNSNRTLTEEIDHSNCAHTISKVNPNEKNCIFLSNKSSKNVNSNFPKPPIDVNNYNSNNAINYSSNKNSTNINNNLKNDSRRESIEGKNIMQNNFTFNNNLPGTNLKENSTLNQNTNGNVLTGPGNNNNLNSNYNNNNASNPDSGINSSNIYITSKNSVQKETIEKEKAQKINQNNYKNNSSSKISNANLANNKAEQMKKFADEIAKSKGKTNVYDIIKKTNGKKTTANSTDSKSNTSKTNLNNRKNITNATNNLSLNSNNNNNKLLGSTEIKRVANDKETSLINLNLNNSQNLDNLNQRNSKILNTSNQINVATSNNFGSSPVKPIKNDQNPFNNLNGSIGFSSIELLKSPNKDVEDANSVQKLAEKATEGFNKYRNDNKQKNALSKRTSEELNTKEQNNNNNELEKNENLINNNNNNTNNNNNKVLHAPQEDDFNFNYNDEKIYSENQENSKKDIIEDYLGHLDKETNKADNDTNPTNKQFNHIRVKSNNYLSNEPLTSIEEIDEKHNLLNTEENAKSNKEVNSAAVINSNQKENNEFNKIDLLKKKSTNNISVKDNNSNELVNNNENDNKKKSMQSLNNLGSSGSSPARKIYKNEADDEVPKKLSTTSIGFNAGSDNKTENKKLNSQRTINYKEDINKEFNTIQNMTNNISPINNEGDTGIKKKNSVDLNITPIIQLKDQNEIYKKGRISRKSNDFADLMMLNNLIDEKLSTAKLDENKKAQTEKPSPAKQQTTFSNITKNFSPQKPESNQAPKSIARSSTLRESADKKTNQSNIFKDKKSSNNLINSSNKTFNKSVTINPNTNTSIAKQKSETINNTSTIKPTKEFQNTTLNKEDNSILQDLNAENSKVLNTNTSIRNLKTGGNELNSSKTFNKLLSPRESAANAIAAAKSLSKQKTLTTKQAYDPRKSIAMRKSVSMNPNNQSAFKNKLNRTGLNNNTTFNSSTLEGKKKSNFVSKSKLQFSKPNQSDLQHTKLSRKSILGKIMSTRNIKGDDRTKNILTDIDKDSFDVSSAQANAQKRPLNQFNSLSRMSISSFRDSYDFDFDRKFSGTLRSDDWVSLKRRNTKSFPDKFFRGNFYKKNSMIISPENQNDLLQNISFNSIPGSGPCENLAIRINENHVIHRTKLKPKTKKAAKYNKGKYELIESFDASFGIKKNYHPNELCVSPNAFIALNEKDEKKEILIKPANLRKEQKEEMDQKLFEKLQGNFIDESITKITKMNRLERMRNNRYSSISVSPTRVMNNFCFSPLLGTNTKNDPIKNNLNTNNHFYGSTQNLRVNQHKDSDADKSPVVFSDRTLKYSSNNDESLNCNVNFNTINATSNVNNSLVKAQKKIGNSKVLLMENNFMICSGDEEKVFSPFDSYIEANNNYNNNNLISPGLNSNLTGGAGHAEITYQNKQKLEKLEKLNKISNTVLSISKANLKQEKSNLNTINDINNKNINHTDSVAVETAGFTITHFDNVKILNENNNNIEQLNSPDRRMKKIKILEPQNVINLFYQMHPEKNKYGFYSFANKHEDYTSNAFSLLKSSAYVSNSKNINNLIANQNNKSLNTSLIISNQVSESINVTHINNLASNLRSNLQKLEINNNNFELEKNQNASNTIKKENNSQNAISKKITFDLPENLNEIDNNKSLADNYSSNANENSKINSNIKNNLAEEGYSLTFASNSNNNNNLNNNLRNAFKKTNNQLNLVAAAISNSHSTNAAVQKALLETKNTLAENIRKHKENFNDADFFDKVKNFLEAKRIQTQAVEQAYLNTDSSINKSLRNRASLSKLDAINRSAEKVNHLNINSNLINVTNNHNNNTNNNNKNNNNNITANNNNKSHSYNPNNLVVVSSGNKNFPFSSNNVQSDLNNINSTSNNSNKSEAAKAPENKTKSLKEALNKINDLDNLEDQSDSNRLVLPMNTRTKAPLRESTEANEKNSFNEANLELLSEKIKKEKQIEVLNQRFQEKLLAMKNNKNKNNHSMNKIIDNFHDFEFENFKNEFKRNNDNNNNNIRSNNFSSKEKALNDNLNTLSNLNNSKITENKKDEMLISDEQLSEFKDKFLGKSEFIDKENVKMFYKKYLKAPINQINKEAINNNNNNNSNNAANKFKNFFLVNKEEKTNQTSEAAKKEKELTMRLEKLKNMLNIDDPKKSKELKNLNTQNFLYEKADRKHETENILNNLNSSNITNVLNLNDSKINVANFNSAGSNNNTLKLLGNLSSLKFGTNFGNSIGSNNTINNIIGNSNNVNNKDNSEVMNKVLPSNQLNIGGGVNTSKNALVRDLKFNF